MNNDTDNLLIFINFRQTGSLMYVTLYSWLNWVEYICQTPTLCLCHTTAAYDVTHRLHEQVQLYLRLEN